MFARMMGAPRRFVRWWWNGDSGHAPWFRRIVGLLFQIFVLLPVLLILLFRFLPIPFTPNMLFYVASGDPLNYSWREESEISSTLGRAVISSEDQTFCSHHGFDWRQIGSAIKSHERHPSRPLRGASTLSQQTARSLFLTPIRSWARKGAEAYFTVLIETLWPKQRILTAYLNLADWGHGNFGAAAAANAYFHESPADLTRWQAARLAAILPDPDEWRAVTPGPYVTRRTGTIMGRMAQVARDRLDDCVR